MSSKLRTLRKLSWNLVAAALLAVLLTLDRHSGTSRLVAAQGGAWSSPVMISTNTRSSWFSDIAVDRYGRPHVVWYSGRSSDGTSLDLMMYSTVVNGEWSEPIDAILTARGGYTVRPAIAMGRADILHATFRGDTSIYYTQAPASEAWTAASWAQRTPLSGSGAGSSYYSDIEVDADGVIHVVWNESVASGLNEKGVWIGTRSGGVLYDADRWPETHATASLDGREVLAVFEDQAGVQWFGTDRGVYRFDGVTWQNYLAQDGQAGPRVSCIAQDRDGRLWFGTDKGLSSYVRAKDEDGDEWQTYTIQHGLPDNTVQAIAIDQQGVMWVGTRQGVARYDGRQSVAFSIDNGLLGLEVLALAVDARGSVWAGMRQGLGRYDGQRWSGYTRENGLPGETVTALVVDAQGTLWCGTENGLGRFDSEGRLMADIGDQPPSGAITALMVDSEGVMWAASETGISRYRRQSWETVSLPQADSRITAIGEDRQFNAMCPLCSDIFYRQSVDGGRIWSAPVNLSRSLAGSAKPQVHTGTGGHVYVTWEEGEDWYVGLGYPLGSGLAHSSDGGRTWTQRTDFLFSRGEPQQITLGVSTEGRLVTVWRTPTESRYYFQVSDDNGASWSPPEHVPGVIVKPWQELNLDGIQAAGDSEGNVHLLVVGRRYAPEEDLGLYHTVWNGVSWAAPELLYASSDPPEWPRIDVGDGDQICATWFSRDKEHITASEQGRYKVWVSCYQTDVPSPGPSVEGTPISPVEPAEPAEATSAVKVPETVIDDPGSGLPPGLNTESDDVGRLLIALTPIAVVLLILSGARLGWFRRRW